MVKLRVLNELLLEFERERGLGFLVTITSHMIGEMRKPPSILVDTERMLPSTIQVLLDHGCKQIKE